MERPRPDLKLIKGAERHDNVIPLCPPVTRFIVEGEDGLTHIVPQRVEYETPAPVIDMFLGVPYHLLGITGYELGDPDDPDPAA